MDFTTMQRKIESKKYSNWMEFKTDFELVVANAKTYNAPDTIYYKEAEKIRQFGVKFIDKEVCWG